MECFCPDGDAEDGLLPCDPKAEVSACCRPGDVCISNGFCFSPGLNALVRRGCTDSTFNSSVCPRACMESDLRTTDALLIPCDNYNIFCCGQNDAARQCCSSGNGTVRIQAGNAVFPASNNATLTVTSLFTATATGGLTTISVSPEAASSNSRTTIGVGAGLGAALIVVSALFLVTGLRLWKIDREMRRLTGERVS